ncbi:hypothetical protein CEP52_007528 [Fusarium oligoseptatum]|uniref:Uncharacterized protein n=1 Tax=Fusarium oligoseptatum TaxID=2604345 RepID=A0A428TMA5_9HYPO|nr:hypothetical protein CEP52_007528 [Fusarium oligoseptatum]
MDLEEGSYPETAEVSNVLYRPWLRQRVLDIQQWTLLKGGYIRHDHGDNTYLGLAPPSLLLAPPSFILESSLFEQLSSFSARLHPLKVIPPLL